MRIIKLTTAIIMLFTFSSCIILESFLFGWAYKPASDTYNMTTNRSLFFHVSTIPITLF